VNGHRQDHSLDITLPLEDAAPLLPRLRHRADVQRGCGCRRDRLEGEMPALVIGAEKTER
jgi:hypothetical protein